MAAPDLGDRVVALDPSMPVAPDRARVDSSAPGVPSHVVDYPAP